jgi:hypothetical protein
LSTRRSRRSAVRGAAIRFVVGNVLYPALTVADTVIATTTVAEKANPIFEVLLAADGPARSSPAP